MKPNDVATGIPEVLSVGERRAVLMREILDVPADRVRPLLMAFRGEGREFDVDSMVVHGRQARERIGDICADVAFGRADMDDLMKTIRSIGWEPPRGFDDMDDSLATVDRDLASRDVYKAFTRIFDRTSALRATQPDPRENYERRAYLEPLGQTPPSQDADMTTLLVSLSGSSRGLSQQRMVAATDALVQALEREGRPVEVLAFTTRAWRGGACRRLLRSLTSDPEQPRMSHPGRMNELEHIVIKGAGEAWAGERSELAKFYLGETGNLRENVDGEALAWAASRMAGGRIVHIADKITSIEDASMIVNAKSEDAVGSFLDRNMAAEVARIRASGIEPLHLDITAHERDTSPSPFADGDSFVFDEIDALAERIGMSALSPAVR